MEKREGKTENIKRRRKSSSSSNSTWSFPLDLTSEILSKLPWKSILRFRCVSKLWSSITKDPYFTNSFETWSKKKRPNLLLCYKEGDKLFVYSFPQHHHQNSNKYSYISSQPIDHYHKEFPEHGYFFNTQSVHGLISFRKGANPIIWNPTLRKFFPLPEPEKSWKGIIVFLGYDPIEGKHKVVCLPRYRLCDECRVLTLGSDQESWRTVKTNHKHRLFNGVYGRCINGVIYYQADLDSDPVIMSFDVRSENFNVMQFPWGKYWHINMLIRYEGKLAFVSSCFNSIWMWVLEDAEKHKWWNHIFSPLPHYDHDLQNMFKLIGITDDGELIYAPGTLFKSLDVIYIDPKRMSFRKVECRGIADDEFRQRNGFGERFLHGLQFFPNHIETLLSL